MPWRPTGTAVKRLCALFKGHARRATPVYVARTEPTHTSHMYQGTTSFKTRASHSHMLELRPARTCATSSQVGSQRARNACQSRGHDSRVRGGAQCRACCDLPRVPGAAHPICISEALHCAREAVHTDGPAVRFGFGQSEACELSCELTRYNLITIRYTMHSCVRVRYKPTTHHEHRDVPSCVHRLPTQPPCPVRR